MPFLSRMKLLWVRLSKGGRMSVIAGLAIILAAASIGSVVIQATFGAVVVNMLLWMLICNNQWSLAFVKKYGGWIDGIVTIVGLFVGGGITAWLTAALTGGFFTIFRNIFAAPVPKPKTEKKTKKTKEAFDLTKIFGKKEDVCCTAV